MRANATPLQHFLRGRTARRWLLGAAITALYALAPVLAMAKVPSPANSTVPAHVTLVGCDQFGSPDPAGTITCVIRNLANIPEPGAIVVIDFTQTPDMQPSMVQPDPGVWVNCMAGSRMLSALCDNNGAVTFHVVGSATHTGASGANDQRVTIMANGVLMDSPTVSAFDEDGVNGVGPADLADFMQDFFSGQYWERSDFDGNGALDPNDLSLWVKEFFSGESVHSGSTASCPQ